MRMYDLGYNELLLQIQQRFGFRLTCFNSGGGCLIWETRLDDGTFLWITDWDAGIYSLARRNEVEAKGMYVGWNIGLYPARVEDGIEDADSCTRLAGVVHRSATAEQLPDLIELALRSLPRNVIHDIDDNSADTVTYGPEYY